MTFDFKHYVPVLRWKAAEIEAFSKLSYETRQNLSPLFELCPNDFIPKDYDNPRKQLKHEDILEKKILNLKDAIVSQHFYLDLIHMDSRISGSGGKNIWYHVLELCRENELNVVPLTGFYGKGVEYQEIISTVCSELQNGAGIRIFTRDLLRKTFHDDVHRLLEILKLSPDDVDFIIDLQLVDNNSLQLRDFLGNLPNLEDWRTLTVLGGSFPRDLSGFKANDTYLLERHEWKKWKSEVISDEGNFSRLPTFGDYTIQHAYFYPPPSMPRVSASIRYTSSDYWIVFRGEWIGKKQGSGSAQYPAQAQLLIDREEYSGGKFSYGDQFIMNKARDGSRPGSVKDWLMVGINHHLTYVVTQISQDIDVKAIKVASQRIANIKTKERTIS